MDAVAAHLALVGCLLLSGWLVQETGALVRAVLRGARRLHLVAPPPAPPAPRRIEQVAADLRRLRPEARRPARGVTMARQRGIVAAYDDTLLLACHALDVDTTLGDLRPGVDREAERLRVEFLLEDAGLDLGGR